MATFSELNVETDLSGVLVSNFSSSATSFQAQFYDSKTGLARAPQSTTLVYTIDKDNAASETILASSISTTSGVTTVNIATNGRGLPKYGSGNGSSTGNDHVATASVGCVNVARPIAVLGAQAMNKTGDTATGPITVVTYANPTARDAAITSPVNGQEAYITSLNAFTDYVNGAWAIRPSGVPVPVAQGGTNATTATAARSNLSAAQSGANSDITSLTALSTPLSTAQGGTGVVSPSAHGVLIANGASAMSTVAPGTTGYALISNGTDWASAAIPITGTPTILLSNTSTTDGNNGAVARGSIVYGNSTPKWAPLAVGYTGSVLTSDGTDVSWGTGQGAYSFYGSAFGGYNPTCAIGFVGSNKTDLFFNYSAAYKIIRSSSTKPFPSITPTSVGTFGQSQFSRYIEGGADWYVGVNNVASAWRIIKNDGTGESNVTFSGTAPGNLATVRCYDPTGNYILALNGSNSTQIRRYTTSGATFTNIASDITLSSAPNSAYNMWCDGTYIYIYDQGAANFAIKRYNMSGTLQETNSMTVNSVPNYFIIAQDWVAYYSTYTNYGSFYKLTLPV